MFFKGFEVAAHGWCADKEVYNLNINHTDRSVRWIKIA